MRKFKIFGIQTIHILKITAEEGNFLTWSFDNRQILENAFIKFITSNDHASD